MMNLDRRSVMTSIAAAPIAAAGLAAAARPVALSAAPEDFEHLVTRHRTVSVDGLDIFYREAGRASSPAVLLLHGFPTSSHMFRHLMPALADRYRVIAPDYPGFGFSSFPAPDRYPYSFERLARTVAGFTDAVGLERYAIYIQDYGAPVGLRLALERPQAVGAIITQNGNAYAEGLNKLWDPLKAYWMDPTPANRAVLRGWLGRDGVRLQYAAGVRDDQLERLAPDNWTLDWAQLSRAGNADVQIELFGDYRTNVLLYPQFQRYLRTNRPPTLVLWGCNDPFFTVEGARAWLRDVPAAELELIDASHFLLETHGAYAAHRIGRFLDRALATST